MEDWEFDAQAGAAGIQLHHCNEWLAEYVIHGEHRLAHAWQENDAAFIDMVEAHLAILEHARTAGVLLGSEEMNRFSRTLFRLARMCAVRASASLAIRVLGAAASACEPDGKTARQLRLYQYASQVCGWRFIGRLCT